MLFGQIVEETSFVSEGWEDLFLLFPLLNCILLFAIFIFIIIHMGRLDHRIQQFDFYLVEALSRVVVMLNQNAQNVSDLANNLTVDASNIARDLKQDRAIRQDVADDLQASRNRADSVDPKDNSGEAADAASKSK